MAATRRRRLACRVAIRIERLTDPSDVLAAAGDLLAREPVLTTVTSTVTHRAVGVPAPDHPRWWLVVRIEEEVVGVVMRTAPFAPHPVYATGMPDDAAAALGRWLHREEPNATAFDGDATAARSIAAAMAAMGGRQVEDGERMRLFELGALRPPTGVAGRRRRARIDDVELCAEWLARFDADAAEQAGRDHRAYDGELSHEEVAARIEQQRMWIWEVEGVPVHLTSLNHPALGVARIGPVYTPREHRGHGYAAACVAGLSPTSWLTASGSASSPTPTTPSPPVSTCGRGSSRSPRWRGSRWCDAPVRRKSRREARDHVV